MAIAEHIATLLHRVGLAVNPKSDAIRSISMPNIGESFPRPYTDTDRIERDPAYGQVVCFCERVTAGEIRDTFDSTIPPTNMDGLRRRTMAMNGRCQGFYCGAEVESMLAAGRTRTGQTL